MAGLSQGQHSWMNLSVAILKRRAQTALEVGKGQLLNSFGELLAQQQSVKEAKLETGMSLTLQLRLVLIQASWKAFAAILGDGSVVTWGDENSGGDSQAVQDRPKDVQQIQASALAFAAILSHGSVVTWGHRDAGGDGRAVQDQLKGVQQIQAFRKAFAAILVNGLVVTWGDAESGGDSRAVQHQLKSVQQIQASGLAFCSYPGRCISRYLGRRVVWWRQSCSEGAAQRREADPSLHLCCCGYPGQRIGSYLRPPGPWR